MFMYKGRGGGVQFPDYTHSHSIIVWRAMLSLSYFFKIFFPKLYSSFLICTLFVQGIWLR